MLAALETSPRMSSLGQPACFRRNEWPLIVMEFLLGRMTSLLVRECVLYDAPDRIFFSSALARIVFCSGSARH
jgi:hypothetical protein